MKSRTLAVLKLLCSCSLLSVASLGQGAEPAALYTVQDNRPQLTLAGAEHLAALPLKCLDKPYPYKTGVVFIDPSLVVPPAEYHPAFYGCYDWHSSVHGHWMLTRLLKRYPDMAQAGEIRERLNQHLSAANIRKELAIFTGDNKSFERIYGWAWLLQLQTELIGFGDDPWARALSANVAPLAQHFSAAWIDFLGKLAYPIRVGEHANLAFGLGLSWDYAIAANDQPLQDAIRAAALRFYGNDRDAPVRYEPSGYDFLSPTLEEANLMRRVLPPAAFGKWLGQFLPELRKSPERLYQVAVVHDRSDGKLVHLDGLNLSRGACLLGIARALPPAQAKPLRDLAMVHLRAALPQVASGDYAGEHWLASFAVYALGQ